MTISAIQIVEVAARDGLQNEPGAEQLTAAEKAAFIRLLAEAGLTRIEAGSFVHPKAVPAMANSAEVAAEIARWQPAFPKVIFSYLVPNHTGLQRAIACGAREVAVFLALSEQFSKANINQPVEEAFAAIAPVIKEAKANALRVRGYLSNIYGYTDLPFSPAQVAARSEQLLAYGCDEISLGDTTAMGTPQTTQRLMEGLTEWGLPLARIAMHLHDTHGLALENVAIAYAHGIRIFDSAAGGVGGCPYANSPKGNLATGQLVDWCEAQGIATPVTDKAALSRAVDFIAGMLQKNRT